MATKVNALTSVVNTVFASSVSNEIEFVVVTTTKGESLEMKKLTDLSVKNLLDLIGNENVSLFARPQFASKFEAGKALAKQVIKFSDPEAYKAAFSRKNEVEEIEENEAEDFEAEVETKSELKPTKKSKKKSKIEELTEVL